MKLNFSWDENKNNQNFKKHGVWFEEAQTVFADRNALELYDKSNSSASEDRYILLGLSSVPRLLIVVYCERKDDVIRIISARKATKKEQNDYEKGI